MNGDIKLQELLDETDPNKKINALIAIGYDNRLILIGHTAALQKLEECNNAYGKKDKLINYGSAAGAVVATLLAVWAAITGHLK
jgi:hypothetical protein